MSLDLGKDKTPSCVGLRSGRLLGEKRSNQVEACGCPARFPEKELAFEGSRAERILESKPGDFIF